MPCAVGKFWQPARGGSAVVEHLVTNPEIEGPSPCERREKCNSPSFIGKIDHFIIVSDVFP
jgi:hypothetical protein